MSTVGFSPYALIPVCVGMVVGATTLLCLCGRKKTRVESTESDRQIQLIDTLAQKILENEGWWLFEGPFRTPGSKTKVDAADCSLRQAAPHEYAIVISTLRECRTFETYEPTNLLQRLTRQALSSLSITGEQLARQAPHFSELLRKVGDNVSITKMTRQNLDVLLLNTKATEDAAIQAFLAKTGSQSRLSASAPARVLDKSR